MKYLLFVAVVCFSRLVFSQDSLVIRDSISSVDSVQVIDNVQNLSESTVEPEVVVEELPLGYPIILSEDTAFMLYAYYGAISSEKRVEVANEYLELAYSENPDFLDSVELKEMGEEIEILYDNHQFLTVTKEDVHFYTLKDTTLNVTPLNLARKYVEDLKDSHQRLTEAKSWKENILSIVYALLLIVGIYLFIKLLNKLFIRLISLLPKYLGDHIHHGIQFKKVEIISAERLSRMILLLIHGIRKLIVLLLIYSGILLLVKVYPGAKMITDQLIDYLVTPLIAIKDLALDFIPNLFYIIVIVFLTKYILKFLHFIAGEIENGNLELAGFHTEWVEPTYKIIKFLIYAFSAVMIFPYLPGSDSPAFKGISIFLGVLFSMGSSSAISNLVAGLVITYMRPFKDGDRVRVGNTEGDVLEKTLLVTKLKTIKNEEITIPNSIILSSHIVNYHANSVKDPLILHTSVTIGYDVPWPKVHEMLIAAVKSVDGILDDPKPFVYQLSLDDYYVKYEINAATFAVDKKDDLYSEIHKNIQEEFNKANVEILSPIYSAIRDGNHTTVADNYVQKDYKAPSFNLGIIDKFFK